jgi:protoporphyrinogen oxidase
MSDGPAGGKSHFSARRRKRLGNPLGKRVVVIGGGVCGCAASLRLARAGCDVVLLERSPNLGGLVVSFEIAGTPIECFYHHVFPNERDMLRLINEMGLGSRFEWRPSTVGVLRQDRIWPFTSAFDLLRFEPLPFIDRVKTGLGSVRLTGSDWRRFDRIGAREWLRVATGDRAMEEIWDPLLRFKYGDAHATVPASWMAARFRQRASARTLRGERLGYMRGGFRQLFDALTAELERLGVSVRTGTGVKRIGIEERAVSGVELDDGTFVEAEDVLYAGQLPGVAGLVPPELADPRWTAIGRLGAICIIVELAKPVTDVYWTNVCEDSVPFGALIEHTNLVPAEDYGGRTIAYLGRYFTADDPVGAADVDVLAKDWLDALDDHLSAFSARDVIAVHPFRTPYAAPLVTLGYRGKIPPITTSIDGLFIATTAQIYPEDRGMNEGLRLATTAVDHVLARR